MGKIRQLGIVMSLAFVAGFTACKSESNAQDRARLERGQLFARELNQGADVPARWIELTSLSVHKYPAKTVIVEVATVGKRGQCEFITEHARIKKDARWAPLPVDIHSKGTDTCAPEFASTLDFTKGTIKKDYFDFKVEFVRGKTFRSLWRVKTYPAGTRENPTCEAIAMICSELKDNGAGGYDCNGKWYRLRDVKAVVDDSLRTQVPLIGTAEREKTDLQHLVLKRQHLDKDELPTSEDFDEDFTDLK